jgi:heme exporter protein C
MKTSERTPRFLVILDIAAFVCTAAAVWMVIDYAPREAVMGDVQRVFYFHVAAGWTGMLGYFCAVITSILYLRQHQTVWDAASLAGVEIGLVFTGLCVVSGSIWARPIWNTWWTWDPRLTTAFIMELIYGAYLLLRRGVDDPGQRGRFSAVYAIVGFITVPLTFLSIRIFRTIHPVIIGPGSSASSGSFDLSPRMLQTFLFSLVTFTILFAAFYWHRLRLGMAQQRLETIEAERSQREENE